MRAAEPDLAVLRDAAGMLRAVLVAVPPTSPTDRATARRIEGAALTLDALARAWRRPTNDRLRNS